MTAINDPSRPSSGATHTWAAHLRFRQFDTLEQLLVRIIEVGYGRLGTWWTNRHVVQTNWLVYLNPDDGAEITLPDGEPVALGPEAAWLLPPWLAYSRRTRPIRHQWVHFDIAGIAPSLARHVFARPFPLPLDPLLRSVGAAMRRSVAAADRSGPQVLCEAHALVATCLARAFARIPDADRRRLVLGASAEDLAPALRRIDEALGGPLYNEALARACGLSVTRFCRRFRAALGQSPTQYIIDRRIALAAQRLMSSNDTIDDIANTCGFADRYAFSRVFAKRMGRNPGSYRARRDGERRRGDRAEVAKVGTQQNPT